MELITKQYRKDNTIYYYDEFVCLDCETSHNDTDTWIVSIQVLFQNEYYLFRSPMELMQFYNDLILTYGLNKKIRLVTYIHNASYDLSYLIGYIQSYLPNKNDREGIYNGNHKIKKYRQGGLEFRCSMFLSGQSLEKWGNNLNIEHKKKVGLYNYNELIFQDTILDKNQLDYDKYDVLSLNECMLKQLSLYDDNVATVPNTSTGYVRREFRKSAQSDRYYRDKYFFENRLDVKSYNFCVNSFAGGYVHNNRFYRNKIVNGLIGHRDFRSEYPSEMMCYPLPFGKPVCIYEHNKRNKKIFHIDDVLKMYPDYSTITRVYITKATLKSESITMPFLQKSKMYFYKTDKLLLDNGRVMHFSGKAISYIDNHTLKILNEQYNMSYVILDVIAFRNEYMPKCLADVINKYFKAKSDLKIELQYNENKYGLHDERTIDSALQLMLCKRMLNGIYGMFATNPLQDDIDIDIDTADVFIETKVLDDTEKQLKLDKYYSSRNNFLPYQVGVFVTALARYELYEYIKTIGYNNILYCDTDSIFYIKTPEIEEKIERLNAIKNKNAINRKAFITNRKGKKIFYDVFEQEQDIIAFKGLHSKCYGYVTTHNELKLTVAGVPDRTLIDMEDKPIYLTREEELAGITKEKKLSGLSGYDPIKALEQLSEDTVFYVNTGKTCQYDIHKPVEINVDGHTIQTSGGAVISTLETKQIKETNIDVFTIAEIEQEVF